MLETDEVGTDGTLCFTCPFVVWELQFAFTPIIMLSHKTFNLIIYINAISIWIKGKKYDQVEESIILVWAAKTIWSPTINASKLIITPFSLLLHTNDLEV